MRCKKIGKRVLSLTLTLAMVFSLVPVMSMNVKAEGTLPGAHVYVNETSGDVFLGGNYIEVGIAKTGSFGTATAVADGKGFHPMESDKTLGLSVDGDGFDVGGAATTGDFFLPGTPEERYVLAYKIDDAVYDNCNAQRNNAQWGAPIQAPVTLDKSDVANGKLAALTTGVTKENVKMETMISFGVNDKYFLTDVKITNQSDKTLKSVRFLRSFDPDQDKKLHNTHRTYNKVISNPRTSSSDADQCAMVVALGKDSLDGFFFASFDKRARASRGVGFAPTTAYEEGFWKDNADVPTTVAKENYTLTQAMLGQNNLNGFQEEDNAIAITFDLGNLAPGQSATFSYYSSLDPDVDNTFSKISGSINYKNERIEELDGKSEYLITVLDVDGNDTTETYNIVAEGEGEGTGYINLSGTDKDGDSYDLIGKKIKIAKVTTDGTSEPQELDISERPNPNDVNTEVVKPEDISEGIVTTTEDSIIISIDPTNIVSMTQEYTIDDGVTWKKPNSEGKVVFDGLETGQNYTVKSRVPATSFAPASVKSDGVTVKTLAPITITEPDSSELTFDADGTKHDFSVTSDVEGAKIEYSLEEGVDYSESIPQLKKPGEYVVYYKVTKEGYSTAYGSFVVKIQSTHNTHAWNYATTEDGKSIVATCTSECYYKNNWPTLTIEKPEMKAYKDGKSAAAILEGLKDFVDDTGVSIAKDSVTYVGRDGTKYESSNKAPVNVGKYTASLTVEGATVSVNYEIIKSDKPAYKVPTGITATYGQKLSDIKLPADDNGTWSWVESSATIDGVGTKTYKAVFTPKDTTNYNKVEGIEIKVTVDKASATTATVPEIVEKTDSSIVVKEIAGQEYSIDGGKTWQTSGTFTNLKPNTEYTVLTRVAETATAKASEPTEIGKIITGSDKLKDEFSLNAGLKVKQTGKKISVNWGEVPNADGYEVYAGYCGSDAKCVATVKGSKTTKATVTKIDGKKLNLAKNYKIYVKAYMNDTSGKKTMARTITAHIVGAKNKKYTNVVGIKLKKSSYDLKVNETIKISAKTIKVSKKKKELSNAHAKKFRYASSDATVATVSTNGKITAKKPGKCQVYVYARNGYGKKITVNVK